MAVSLLLQGAVLTTLAVALAGAASATRGAWMIHHQLSSVTRIEHLLDHALARAGATAATTGPVVRPAARELTLRADLDGDGVVDGRSAELTAFALGSSADTIRLTHRMGRQSMTIATGLPDAGTFEYFSRHGSKVATSTATSVVQLPLTGGHGVLAAAIPVRGP